MSQFHHELIPSGKSAKLTSEGFASTFCALTISIRVMRVSILTFSITGNTKLTAKRIASQLTDAGNTVSRFSIVKLGKEIDSLGASSSPLLASVRTALESSDVVALSAFSNGFHPSHRVNEVFEENVLPRSLFSRMRFFFIFATAGQRFGRTLNVLATLLYDKNPSAKYLGYLGILAPENCPPLQPERPFRDTWRPSELVRADEFGAQIARYLAGTDPIPSIAVSKAYSWQFVTGKNGLRRWFVAPPECDREKCQRCGTCERKCPYNAIKLSQDIEDGFPVFDRAKCEGCARCFNTCPAEAIEMPKANTKTRSRYPKANLVPAGEKCEDGMIAQPFPQGYALNKRNAIGKQSNLGFVAAAVLLIALVIAFVVKRK
jgi:ferredoxin